MIYALRLIDVNVSFVSILAYTNNEKTFFSVFVYDAYGNVGIILHQSSQRFWEGERLLSHTLSHRAAISFTKLHRTSGGR